MNIYWVPGARAGGFVAAHLDDCSPIFCPLHLHFWDWSERQWYWKLANKSKEGKGLLEQYCQLMHVVMQNKTSWLFLNLMHFWRGDDQAKWLNLTCDDLTGFDYAGRDIIFQRGRRDTEPRPHVHTGGILKGRDYALTLISTAEIPKWSPRQSDAPDSSNGHLHLFRVAVCRFAVGAELRLPWIRAADLPVMIPAGWWKLEGEESCRTMSGRPPPIPETSYLPLHSNTEESRAGKKPRKDLWIPANMCPAWGSPSWRWDEGRIDWRWWTINEGIDFRVRVAGWGLEINWNKDINTSTGLPPGHAHTFSQIYYETCLA